MSKGDDVRKIQGMDKATLDAIATITDAIPGNFMSNPFRGAIASGITKDVEAESKDIAILKDKNASQDAKDKAKRDLAVKEKDLSERLLSVVATSDKPMDLTGAVMTLTGKNKGDVQNLITQAVVAKKQERDNSGQTFPTAGEDKRLKEAENALASLSGKLQEGMDKHMEGLITPGTTPAVVKGSAPKGPKFS